jgi:DNA-binding PadR family transcriptional regulator
VGVLAAKHAVLGLVIERPGYGYQLTQRLEERFGSWGWKAQGVYGALDQLAREGHVDPPGVSRRTAPRTIYKATLGGRGFFEDWVRESSALSPVRQDLDLKIALAGPEFWPSLIDQVHAQEQQCIDELGELSRRVAEGGEQSGRPLTWREATSVHLRDAEIKLLEFRIEWLQDVRKTMQRFLEQSGRLR